MNTFESPKLSRDEIENIQQQLQDFAYGNKSLLQISVALEGIVIIDFDEAPNHREISFTNRLDLREFVEVQIGIEQVRLMLNRYIEDDILESEISNWAAFVFLSDFFVPEGKTKEESQQAGEGPVWDIIQRIMTPMIFGGFNKQIAHHYLNELEVE